MENEFKRWVLKQVFIISKIDNRLANEKAEYAKSDAPKLTPSKTNAKELMGWVAATNWKRGNEY